MSVFFSASSNSSTTGTNVTVASPPSVSPGMWVDVIIHCNNNTTIVDNNGSTTFTEYINDYQPNGASGHTVSVFSRRIQAGDPSTYNYTIGTSGRWSVIALAFNEVDPNNVYDIQPSTTNATNQNNSDAPTIDTASITTTVNNSIHVICGFFDDGSAGFPSGPGGIYVDRAATVNQPIVVSTGIISTAGSTGTSTITGTTSSPRITLSYAIRGFTAEYKTAWITA